MFCGYLLGCSLCLLPSQSSSCSSSFLQMGKCSAHEHFSTTWLGITIAWGIAVPWGGASVFTVSEEVGLGIRGNDQSFLVSNRFSETEPVLGEGVPCLTEAVGISSNVGGLDPFFWGLVVGHGTSQNFPVANLYTITSIDSTLDLTTGV